MFGARIQELDRIYCVGLFYERKKIKKNMSAICHQYQCSDKRNVSHGARNFIVVVVVHPLRVLFATCLHANNNNFSLNITTRRTTENTTKLKLLFASHQFESEFQTKFIYDRLGCVLCIGHIVHIARRRIHSLKLLYYARREMIRLTQ